MAQNSKYALSKIVMEASVANTWDEAIDEWNIAGYFEDETANTTCLCGHENLRHVFTIKNDLNGNALSPIGSSCIKKFEKDQLAEELKDIQSFIRLKAAITDCDEIELATPFFSKRLLLFLYKLGAFPPNSYNSGDGHYDYKFMVDMFNKRNKSDLTPRQKGKLKALLNNLKEFIIEYDVSDLSL